MTGATRPFNANELARRYPDHATYVARFAAASDRLVAGRWISEDDAEAMKKAADAALVPESARP